ncbi:hypothetical protein [Streptomyces siamensis]
MLSAGLTAALTLTACGVPPSDAIEAGEPASGIFPRSEPSGQAVVSLYFLADGDPKAYPRKIDHPVDLRTVVGQPFYGPTRGEAVTATTQLPHLTDTPGVSADGGSDVSIKLPDDVAPLSHPAMLQLACTVAHVSGSLAASPANARRNEALASTSVHVLGDGRTTSQTADDCPSPRQS